MLQGKQNDSFWLESMENCILKCGHGENGVEQDCSATICVKPSSQIVHVKCRLKAST